MLTVSGLPSRIAIRTHGSLPGAITNVSALHFRVSSRYNFSASAHCAQAGTNLEHDAGSPGRRLSQESFENSRIFVGASEVGNLINLNPYVKVSDALERLWEKNNKRSFSEALARNGFRSFTSKERLKTLGLLEAATSIIETDIHEKFEKQLKEVLLEAPTAQDRAVIRDFVHTSRGTKTEKKTFDALQTQRGKLQPDNKLYKRLVHIPDANVEYFISGYIDGIELHRGRLIEIKSRQNRLFGHVPLYEQVQCQAYMFLTGLKTCEHTESFEGKTKSTTLDYEEAFWEEVISQLNSVVVAFVKILKSQSYQDHFLRTGSLDESQKRKRRSSSKYLQRRPE